MQLNCTDRSGRVLDKSNRHKNNDKGSYDKSYFARYIVKPKYKEINFEKFNVIFDSINEIIEHFQGTLTANGSKQA